MNKKIRSLSVCGAAMFLSLLVSFAWGYEKEIASSVVYGKNDIELQPLLSWSLFPGAVQVMDSSTIRIIANGLKKEIKLYGVCSTGIPQKDQDAVRLIMNLINDKRTEIKIYGQNEDKEDLGLILVDGVDINRVVANKQYVLSGKKCGSAFVSEQNASANQTIGSVSKYSSYRSPSRQSLFPNSSCSHSDSICRPKTVHVRGHYKKNGTYVRPYLRSAPKR